MAEEKRNDPLKYEGCISNLMGVSLALITDAPARLWPTFPPDEAMLPVVPTVRLSVKEDVPEEEQLDAGAIKDVLPDVSLAVDGEMETVGLINGVYRLVKPKDGNEALMRLCKESYERFESWLSVPKAPSTVTIKKWTGNEQYFIMRPDAACFCMLKHYVRQEELEHWLIPAESVSEGASNTVACRSFMPAHFLIPGKAE